MNPNSLRSENKENYLYYVICEPGGKVRGHIIGAQHWVEEKDKGLNNTIIESIRRSARIILEQPPGSKLLPKENNYFAEKIVYILEDLDLSLDPSAESHIPESEKIQSRLEYIKEQVLAVEDGFMKVDEVVHRIPSDEDKLIFLDEVEKMIAESRFDLKLVSLEDNINHIVQAENKKIEPLENFDLKEKIREAIKKQQEREKSEGIVKSNDSSPIKIDLEAHKLELHQAWVKGEEKKLSELIDKSFKLYKESPELDEVHRPRGKDMADKIVEVMKQLSKEENAEATIMMGTAHLVYTVRTNVIKHLENAFKNDLKGWSVKQVKINEG